MYSISAKYHSIKQKLKGNQYIQIDTDRFSGILDELTTWLHSSPAVRKQSAEHWADKHGTLGDEHAIADHLGAAQQSTATIREPAQRTSKIELLRQRHDSNAAEHWQDEQTERMSKRRRVDEGLIDLTEESELEAEVDAGAAGCLEPYCKGCTDVLTQSQTIMIKTFFHAVPQAVAARSSTVRSTKMHCISATAPKSMHAISNCALLAKGQPVESATDGICQGC